MKNLSLNGLCLLLYASIVLVPWSPVVSWLLGVSNKVIFGLLLTMFMVVAVRRFNINKTLFILIFSFLIVSLFFSLIGNKLNLFASMLGLPLSLLMTQHIFKLESNVEVLVDYFTCYSVVAILMSCIGLVYSLSGGSALLFISNFDGRDSALFLTTFSNAQIGGIIRPSFIYDEPGALSFVIVFTAIVRDLSGRSKVNTLCILAIGLVTFSLTHAIILVLFVLVGFRQKSGLIFGLVVVGALVVFSLSTEALKPFVDRVDGFISGEENNRTRQVDNFFGATDLSKLFWVGVTDCTGSVECGQKYGDMTSNPFSVFFGKGILGLLVQCSLYVFFLFALFRYRLLFPALAMLALISQRPFLTAIGYSTMIVFVVFHVCSIRRMRLNNEC